MAKSLNLADVLSLADSGAYGGNRVLSANSAALALCSGVWLSELSNWQGAGYDLTQSEIDTIEALVAMLEFELGTEGGGDVGNYIKIAESVTTADATFARVDDFLDGDFGRYELFIHGLLTDRATTWHDGLKCLFNFDTTSVNYNSFSRWLYDGGEWDIENIGNFTGVKLVAVCSTVDNTVKTFGSLRMTINNPQGSDYKTIQYQANVSGMVAGRQTFITGSGVWKSTAEITQIDIAPQAGTTFLIDPADADEPDELRMTLYGLE